MAIEDVAEMPVSFTVPDVFEPLAGNSPPPVNSVSTPSTSILITEIQGSEAPLLRA